jgi:hypothetical protein
MLSFDPSNKFNSLTSVNTLLARESDTERLSALELARTQIAQTANLDVEEASADIGLAMGGRRLGGRGKDADKFIDPKEKSIKILKLVTEIGSLSPVDPTEMEDKENRWMYEPNTMATLLQEHPDVGQAALRVGLLLAHKTMSKKMQKKLQGLLGMLLGDDQNIGIALFAAVEFGSTNEELRRDLKSIYQHVTEAHKKLSDWLVMLGDSKSRERKLRSMIHIASYELSASGAPIMGCHLGGVIQDLRKLLCVLSVTTYCEQSARVLKIPGLDGDDILLSTVKILEEPWLDSGIIPELLPTILPENIYPFVTHLYKITQVLPEACFRDVEHREQLRTTLFTFRESRIDS